MVIHLLSTCVKNVKIQTNERERDDSRERVHHLVKGRNSELSHQEKFADQKEMSQWRRKEERINLRVSVQETYITHTSRQSQRSHHDAGSSPGSYSLQLFIHLL
jgi:thiamine kinase-like enzyme